MEWLSGRVILVWGFKRALLAILAGAIGVLALPPFGFFAAMFVSFTLLVWLLDGVAASPDSGLFGRLWPAFFTGWLFGFGYFVAGLWWLGHALLIDADEFAWALPLAILGLPAFLAIFYGVATVLARILWSDGMGRIAALAFSFGLLEWLRSFLFTGFPWNAIGYGAMPIPLMMQSAHLIGVLGVTVLAVFVFAAPALLGTRQGRLPGIGLAIVIAAAHVGYGYYALNLPDAPAASGKATPVVRIVQPSIDQQTKMDTDADRTAIFDKHLALSVQPPANGGKRPDIIVWPETAVPFILTDNRDALARIADQLEDDQVLITGAVRVEDMGPGVAPRYYNSIYVIDGRGQIIDASDKTHLVPFGEYVPFEHILDYLGIENVIELPGGFSAATKRRLLTMPDGIKFYPLICYEIIFPNEMTPEIRQADAILNVTNDGWFGDTLGPYQHFLQARVRAVEQGLPLIRSANTGISAFVDPHGRVLSGIDYNQQGFIDTTLGSAPASGVDDKARKTYYWLIVGLVGLVAAVSRMGFISRVN